MPQIIILIILRLICTWYEESSRAKTYLLHELRFLFEYISSFSSLLLVHIHFVCYRIISYKGFYSIVTHIHHLGFQWRYPLSMLLEIIVWFLVLGAIFSWGTNKIGQESGHLSTTSFSCTLNLDPTDDSTPWLRFVGPKYTARIIIIWFCDVVYNRISASN